MRTVFLVLVLGLPLSVAHAQSIGELRGAAQSGDTKAQARLCQMGINGINGLSPSFEEVVLWCEESAEQEGDPRAQFVLGYAYLMGGKGGVGRDVARGLQLLREAGEQGIEDARRALAHIYGGAFYGTPDLHEAARWFEALAQDNAFEKFNLGNRYVKGHGVPQNYERGLSLIKESAALGYEKAQFVLGTLYEKGVLLPKNDEQAYIWYSVSAERGEHDAFYARESVKKRLSPEALARAEDEVERLQRTIPPL